MPQKEYSPNHEIDPAVLEGFAKTFIPRQDMFPLQQADGSYITVHRAFSAQLLTDHLKGRVTLGAYALDENSNAKWICLDADDETEWQGILEVAKTLEQHGINGYRELSRRGGHFWLFLPSLPGVFARRFAMQLLKEHHLEQVEVYPKQEVLVSGPGSLVRLPFGNHRKSGKVYYFVDKEGKPIAPTIRDQIRVLLSPARVPLPYLNAVLERVPPEPPAPPRFINVNLTPANGMVLSERLKASISVLDFVSLYVSLDNLNTGFCPFHKDRVKSFSVNAKQNYWNCFAGCGGGSIIDFWMKWREKHGLDPGFTATVTDLRYILL